MVGGKTHTAKLTRSPLFPHHHRLGGILSLRRSYSCHHMVVPPLHKVLMPSSPFGGLQVSTVELCGSITIASPTLGPPWTLASVIRQGSDQRQITVSGHLREEVEAGHMDVDFVCVDASSLSLSLLVYRMGRAMGSWKCLFGKSPASPQPGQGPALSPHPHPTTARGRAREAGGIPQRPVRP